MRYFSLWIKNYFADYEWKFKVKVITFFILIALIVFDQVVKLLVKNNFTLNVEHVFLPGFINLKYVINHGSAFGLNQNRTGLLIIVAFMIALILLIWWIFSYTTGHIIAITFLLAGTIGNLIDRVFNNGGVIDFLKWELFEPKTIFNLADVMVTLGVIIIAIVLIVSGIKNIIYNNKEKKALQNKNNNKNKQKDQDKTEIKNPTIVEIVAFFNPINSKWKHEWRHKWKHIMKTSMKDYV